MTKRNKGKGFEAHVQASFERVPNCVVWRLKDQIGRYKNVTNPCDFFFYYKPTFYAIECKSTKGASLAFSDIREAEQIDDLHTIAQQDGVVAGFLIWFRDKDVTVFVRHDIVYQAYKNRERQSIALKDILALSPSDYCILEGVKQRVYYDYDALSLLSKNFF